MVAQEKEASKSSSVGWRLLQNTQGIQNRLKIEDLYHSECSTGGELLNNVSSFLPPLSWSFPFLNFVILHLIPTLLFLTWSSPSFFWLFHSLPLLQSLEHSYPSSGPFFPSFDLFLPSLHPSLPTFLGLSIPNLGNSFPSLGHFFPTLSNSNLSFGPFFPSFGLFLPSLGPSLTSLGPSLPFHL